MLGKITEEAERNFFRSNEDSGATVHVVVLLMQHDPAIVPGTRLLRGFTPFPNGAPDPWM